MLKSLTVRGFKSLQDVTIDLPRLAVLFGPNAAGKSNLLDAIQALSRIGTQRTLAEALAEQIRGYPVEAFTFPRDGLPGLLSASSARFSLQADLTRERDTYRYRVDVEITPSSGALAVADEYLCTLGSDGAPKGTASIEQVEGQLRIRGSRRGRPRYEPLRLNYAILSDPRLGEDAYREIERARAELFDWRAYYLDPRVAMREAQPPSDVRDIGALGGAIAPFLYRLRAEHPGRFDAVSRTLSALVPAVQEVTVDLDHRRGTLDILVREDGIDFSTRIVSEGTLRVLALCAIASSPWGGSLVAFEEPENGVHPRRIELIAQLLTSLALDQKRQVIVTTHSPLFCDAVLKQARERERPDDARLFNVHRRAHQTVVRPFDVTGPLFQLDEINSALSVGAEDGLFESLLLRGMLDE